MTARSSILVAGGRAVRLRLHASAFKRTSDWPVVDEGQRIHDLRPTAACLWLARCVDPVAVQAWLGHASIRRRTSTGTTSERLLTAPGWTD